VIPIVINDCRGGFGLSHEAVIELARRKGLTLYSWVHPLRDFRHYEPYDGVSPALVIHYTTSPDKGAMNDSYYIPSPDRDDPDLIAVVESMGESANGRHAKLKIVEIPDGVEWEIDEYDGMEQVSEKHRTWG
jgi:hypothetical protein